jgi:formylglycine-generating enzyme required for sulfatase activity
MKRVLIVPLLAACLGAVGVVALHDDRPPPFDPPALVAIPQGEVVWRPLGNFSQNGKARTPPTVLTAVAGFQIMKYQVTRAQYAACVRDEACSAVTAQGGVLPQTMVNWQDATDFALWYSKRSGGRWRLPTEIEWQRAAAERYGDSAADPDTLDPGERMLENYRNGILLRGGASPTLRPRGGFGENTLGVSDISGNVWEWTNGCVTNGTLQNDGRIATTEPYCGVRIAGGRHRAAVIDFVRDASVGGCAAGLPPDHLGFRLVRAR